MTSSVANFGLFEMMDDEEIMSNWVDDQAGFMRAGGQSVGVPNTKQIALYAKLVREESRETDTAAILLGSVRLPDSSAWGYMPHETRDMAVVRAAELADGAVDTIVVCLGLLHSMGVDPERAWQEVLASNMSKVDPVTGKVIKRDDGKILKPDGYFKPDMERVVRESWGIESS